MLQVNDIIKKPKGRYNFRVLRTNYGWRYGDLYIRNIKTGKEYWVFDNDGWVRQGFWDTMTPLIDKKKFKFDFKGKKKKIKRTWGLTKNTYRWSNWLTDLD